MTKTTDPLRQRTIDALLLHAALEDDPGGAGYSEGMAQNFRANVGPGRHLSEPYIERIEAAINLLLPEVEEARVSQASIQARRHGRWGCLIQCASRQQAAALAARLTGMTEGS